MSHSSSRFAIGLTPLPACKARPKNVVVAHCLSSVPLVPQLVSSSSSLEIHETRGSWSLTSSESPCIAKLGLDPWPRMSCMGSGVRSTTNHLLLGRNIPLSTLAIKCRLIIPYWSLLRSISRFRGMGKKERRILTNSLLGPSQERSQDTGTSRAVQTADCDATAERDS